MSISIVGLDKATVLQALHTGSKAQGMGWLQYSSGGLSVEDCQQALDRSPWIDYLQGRVIKVDFSTDDIDPGLYDRDNGSGALEHIVTQLRQRSTISAGK